MSPLVALWHMHTRCLPMSTQPGLGPLCLEGALTIVSENRRRGAVAYEPSGGLVGRPALLTPICLEVARSGSLELLGTASSPAAATLSSVEPRNPRSCCRRAWTEARSRLIRLLLQMSLMLAPVPLVLALAGLPPPRSVGVDKVF